MVGGWKGEGVVQALELQGLTEGNSQCERQHWASRAESQNRAQFRPSQWVEGIHSFIHSLTHVFKQTFIECSLLDTIIDDGDTEMNTYSLISLHWFPVECGEQMTGSVIAVQLKRS